MPDELNTPPSTHPESTPAPPASQAQAPATGLSGERPNKPRPPINQKQAVFAIGVMIAAVFGILYYQQEHPAKKAKPAGTAPTAQNSAPQQSAQADANYENRVSEAVRAPQSQLHAADSYDPFAAIANSQAPSATSSDPFAPGPAAAGRTSNEPPIAPSALGTDCTITRRGARPIPCDTVLLADQDKAIKTMSSPLVVMSARGAYQSTPYLDGPPASGSAAAGASAPPFAKALGIDQLARTVQSVTSFPPAGPTAATDSSQILPAAHPTAPLSTPPLFAAQPPASSSAAQQQPPATPAQATRPDKHQLQAAANRASGPSHKLFEGTIIETVLTNRLNATFAGPVTCLLTTDVWSHNRAHLLLPAGTRALGEVHRVTGTSQDRVAVVFHRLLMPDGFSVSLDQFTGMNQIGETGLKDKINHHYTQIFGVSLALGALAGFSSHGTSYGNNPSATDAWRQGFSQSLSQEATQILDKYLNILPTITIREGTRVKIYLTDDLVLPAYDAHRMSGDL